MKTLKKESGLNKLVKLLIIMLLVAIALYTLLPFVWMVSASFKSEKDVMSVPIKWIPDNFMLDNFKRVLNIDTKSTTNYHFMLAYWNSIKVSVVSTICSVSSAALAGYAFAKLNFRGSKVLFIIYLAQLMVPTQLTLIFCNGLEQLSLGIDTAKGCVRIFNVPCAAGLCLCTF